jgi:L-rhamnose mutarotase
MKSGLRRHVLTVNLKNEPGVIESYCRYHRDVWPEVQNSLREHGVERMDIHLLGRRLVMVVEMRDGLDCRTVFQLHAASNQRVAEWERLMRSLQEPSPDAPAGEWWAVMEPVFHLDPHALEPETSEHQAAGAPGSINQATSALGSTQVRESSVVHVANRPRRS